MANLHRITRMNIDMMDLYGQSLKTNVGTLGRFRPDSNEPFALDEGATVRIGRRRRRVLEERRNQAHPDFTAVDRFTARPGPSPPFFVRRGDDLVRITTRSRTRRATVPSVRCSTARTRPNQGDGRTGIRR